MKLIKAATLLSILAVPFLTACAQQDEPEVMVQPEPTYDKYGNVVN